MLSKIFSTFFPYHPHSEITLKYNCHQAPPLLLFAHIAIPLHHVSTAKLCYQQLEGYTENGAGPRRGCLGKIISISGPLGAMVIAPM